MELTDVLVETASIIKELVNAEINDSVLRETIVGVLLTIFPESEIKCDNINNNNSVIDDHKFVAEVKHNKWTHLFTVMSSGIPFVPEVNIKSTITIGGMDKK